MTDRNAARREEARIKRLPRAAKLQLIESRAAVSTFRPESTTADVGIALTRDTAGV